MFVNFLIIKNKENLTEENSHFVLQTIWMSASADIANFQMSAPFLVWGGAHLSRVLIKFVSYEERRSFEGGLYSGRDALSDNYGIHII